MTETSTFAPLQNKRTYSENECVVLLYFFTNIDKNIYCAKNTLSNQLWAFLVGQYSRSELSMRDRFLQLFDDSSVALEKGIITKEEHISLDDLAENIKKSSSFSLDFFETKASDFLKKWGVDYGHNSLKDADRIRFAIEWVSQVFTKVIESPFPALWDFQEKSTRYLHFWAESLIYPDDLKNSKFGWKATELTKKLIDTYLKFTPVVKEALSKNEVIKREEFASDRAFENTLNAKAFDILRYLLPSNVATSLWASFSTRSLESHLSYMLAHPLEEVRMIASAMHKEAMLLSPGLLSRVAPVKYDEIRRKKINSYLKDFFKMTSAWDDETWYHKGISDKERVNIVFEWDLDGHILASILFENSRAEWLSYEECMDLVEDMDNMTKAEIMKSYLEDRGEFDRMPRALQHSTVMMEYLVDFGAYRDIQRHRASTQLWQWASAIHGYDYPEFMDLEWMEEFKKSYDELLTEITIFAKEMVKEDDYLSEYVTALGHLVRTTFEMSPGQLAYVLEMRTTPWGHHSYRRLFVETFAQFKKMSPLFAKYIRVGDLEEESSRKKQEEKAEEKRKKLGI